MEREQDKEDTDLSSLLLGLWLWYFGYQECDTG